MANVLMTMSGALIFAGILLAVTRLVLGKTVIDRIVAMDLLTILTIAMIALYTHIDERFIYLDVALVYGLLSFLAVLAAGRYLEKGL